MLLYVTLRHVSPGRLLSLNVACRNSPYWGGIGGAANLHAPRRLPSTWNVYPRMSVTVGNIYRKKNGRFGFMVNAGIGLNRIIQGDDE